MIGTRQTAAAQYYSVRTNGLLWLTGTINGSFGVALSKKWSLDITAAYNPIVTKNLRASFGLLQEGFRKWSFDDNIGFFWGMHLSEALYDFGNADHHFKGFTVGLGASVGYTMYLSRRWNLCFELGASVLYMNDKKEQYFTPDSQDEIRYNYSRWAVAPTKADISIVYLF